jgi:hypothetical protein
MPALRSIHSRIGDMATMAPESSMIAGRYRVTFVEKSSVRTPPPA